MIQQNLERILMCLRETGIFIWKYFGCTQQRNAYVRRKREETFRRQHGSSFTFQLTNTSVQELPRTTTFTRFCRRLLRIILFGRMLHINCQPKSSNKSARNLIHLSAFFFSVRSIYVFGNITTYLPKHHVLRNSVASDDSELMDLLQLAAPNMDLTKIQI